MNVVGVKSLLNTKRVEYIYTDGIFIWKNDKQKFFAPETPETPDWCKYCKFNENGNIFLL